MYTASPGFNELCLSSVVRE